MMHGAYSVKLTFVLIAKKGKVLQSMIYRLTEIGRCFGVEKNVEKTKVKRI